MVIFPAGIKLQQVPGLGKLPITHIPAVLRKGQSLRHIAAQNLEKLPVTSLGLSTHNFRNHFGSLHLTGTAVSLSFAAAVSRFSRKTVQHITGKRTERPHLPLIDNRRLRAPQFRPRNRTFRRPRHRHDGEQKKHKYFRERQSGHIFLRFPIITPT